MRALAVSLAAVVLAFGFAVPGIAGRAPTHDTFGDASVVSGLPSGDAASAPMTTEPSEPGDAGASIAGTVTSEEGDPLEGICVDVWDAEADGDLDASAVTEADGTYSIPGVPTGQHKVSFTECNFDRTIHYGQEWYDDQPDFDLADVVTLAPGDQAVGIDAALTAVGGVIPISLGGDLAVTGLAVENVTLRTDEGDTGLGTGWSRIVRVEVANLTDDAPGFGFLEVDACPATFGPCRRLAGSFISLGPGTSDVERIKWNGAGSLGDVTVTATVHGCDRDPSNNQASVDHYVIVGGTGFGVDSGAWRDDSTYEAQESPILVCGVVGVPLPAG